MSNGVFKLVARNIVQWEYFAIVATAVTASVAVLPGPNGTAYK